jgi:uncharacterized membrane protein
MDEYRDVEAQRHDDKNAIGYARMAAVVGVVFLALCITSVIAHNAGDDWLSTILSATMSGLCLFIVLGILVMKWRVNKYYDRPQKEGSQ